MNCRPGCGACCIAPSINQAYSGMPKGKPAGAACVHLDHVTMRCRIWGSRHYPRTCHKFTADVSVCGNSREEALVLLGALERDTTPE